MEKKLKNDIENIINGECGFDIYIAMKNSDSLIKRFYLEETEFKARVKIAIKEIIQKKFLENNVVYSTSEKLAENCKSMYVIQQDEDYQPFEFLNVPDESIISFTEDEAKNAEAILFKFIVQEPGKVKKIWAYQRIHWTAIPNRKKNAFQLLSKKKNGKDIFYEDVHQMFVIRKKVDMLIIDDSIITSDINMLERHFFFERFIRKSAIEIIDNINQMSVINNIDKLYSYCERNNKKYAKKILQIPRFPVANMKNKDLLEKINHNDRWKGVFVIKNNSICLNTYEDVKNVIDLYIERYTKSDVTGAEYDTSAKDLVVTDKKNN